MCFGLNSPSNARWRTPAHLKVPTFSFMPFLHLLITSHHYFQNCFPRHVPLAFEMSLLWDGLVGPPISAPKSDYDSISGEKLRRQPEKGALHFDAIRYAGSPMSKPLKNAWKAKT